MLALLAPVCIALVAPDALEADVRSTLGAFGLCIDDQAGMTLEVTPVDQALHIVLRRQDGRRAARTVRQVATVGSLVDSWLMEPHWRVVTPAAPAVEESSPRAAGSMTPRAHRFTVAASADLAADDSLWTSFHFGLCRQTGPFCLGAGLGASFDTDEFGRSEEIETKRFGIDLLLHADCPLRWGQAIITPGLRLGAGWMHTIREVNPMSSTPLVRDTLTPRFGANLGLAWALDAEVFVGLSAQFDVAPLAHTEPFGRGVVQAAGEPGWFLRGALSMGYRF